MNVSSLPSIGAFFRHLLFIMALLALGAQAQLPPPPPLSPEPVDGEEKPFDPKETHEAILYPELKLAIPSDSVPKDPINLVQAIQIAWSLQPDIREAQGRLRQSEGQVVQERAAILPNIDISSSYSHITTNSGSGGGTVVVGNNVVGGGSGGSSTTDRLVNRIGFSQLLFDFGRTRNLILQADLLRQSAAADVLSTQNDVALEIKLALYRLIQARRLVRVGEDDLANRQKQLQLAQALYDAGDLAPGDVVRAQSAVTNSVVRLNSSRLEAENAHQDLVQSVGFPPLSRVEFIDSSEPEIASRDLAGLLQKAIEQRPDLLAAQRSLEASKAGLDAAYARNRPELSTFTGVTYQGDLDGVQYPTLTAQLSLSFDIYDGGARAGAVTAAEGQIEVSEAQLLRTKLSVERLVGSILAQLITSERNVEAARAGVDSAREGVRIAEGRYGVGLDSLTDVLAAQTAYVQAQTNLTDSWAEVNFARARMRHALAAPLEEGFVWEPLVPRSLNPDIPEEESHEVPPEVR